mmetsp:Transcript_14924/g.59838  ORF Transcript_14924/g.59838 Transcript_14924/m.59838 type:complete len:753 (+) Transcript_14924:142-2400(+)
MCTNIILRRHRRRRREVGVVERTASRGGGSELAIEVVDDEGEGRPVRRIARRAERVHARPLDVVAAAPRRLELGDAAVADGVEDVEARGEVVPGRLARGELVEAHAKRVDVRRERVARRAAARRAHRLGRHPADRPDVGRHVAQRRRRVVAVRRPRVVARERGRDDRSRRFGGERAAARARGPLVARRAAALRRAPRSRGRAAGRRRRRAVVRRRPDEAREVVVADLDAPVLVDHEVGALEVAVADAAAVEIEHAAARLRGARHGELARPRGGRQRRDRHVLGRAELAAAAKVGDRVQQVRQRPQRHVLRHDRERHERRRLGRGAFFGVAIEVVLAKDAARAVEVEVVAADGVFDDDAHHDDDVGVAQARHEHRLGAEPVELIDDARARARPAAGEAQLLDGHVRAAVARAVDVAERAGADALADLEVRALDEDVAEHEPLAHVAQKRGRRVALVQLGRRRRRRRPSGAVGGLPGDRAAPESSEAAQLVEERRRRAHGARARAEAARPRAALPRRRLGRAARAADVGGRRDARRRVSRGRPVVGADAGPPTRSRGSAPRRPNRRLLDVLDEAAAATISRILGGGTMIVGVGRPRRTSLVGALGRQARRARRADGRRLRAAVVVVVVVEEAALVEEVVPEFVERFADGGLLAALPQGVVRHRRDGRDDQKDAKGDEEPRRVRERRAPLVGVPPRAVAPPVDAAPRAAAVLATIERPVRVAVRRVLGRARGREVAAPRGGIGERARRVARAEAE